MSTTKRDLFLQLQKRHPVANFKEILVPFRTRPRIVRPKFFARKREDQDAENDAYQPVSKGVKSLEGPTSMLSPSRAYQSSTQSYPQGYYQGPFQGNPQGTSQSSPHSAP